MDYVIDPPPVPSLPVRGAPARFPVRRVYCVGRNYAAHAIEMGHDPDREPPFFFQKNPDNLVPGGGNISYPPQTADLHHEIELVAVLGAGGRDIDQDSALECVWGYVVGIDLTRRDLQGEAKKMGRPWEVGKAFEMSAPCSAIVPAGDIGHPDSGTIHLDVNGERRQDGDLNQLIWKLPEVIAHLSRLFTLAPGDLIFTGTPAGVAAVGPGDRLEGAIEGVGEISVVIT